MELFKWELLLLLLLPSLSLCTDTTDMGRVEKTRNASILICIRSDPTNTPPVSTEQLPRLPLGEGAIFLTDQQKRPLVSRRADAAKCLSIEHCTEQKRKQSQRGEMEQVNVPV